MMHYILLPSGEIAEEPDPIKWAKWMNDCNPRRIKLTEIGEVKISTVFLGLDHNFGFSGPPILFETMVFGGEYDQHQKRYSSKLEAEIGHDIAVQMVLNGNH